MLEAESQGKPYVRSGVLLPLAAPHSRVLLSTLTMKREWLSGLHQAQQHW